MLILVTSVGLGFFFLPLCLIVSQNKHLFTKRYGRKHRIVGLVQLVWLNLGYLWILYDLIKNSQEIEDNNFLKIILYDTILGILGTSATLTAASEFKKVHEKVKNVASGTLEPQATVTYAEMIEHSFYQILNLLQILFLHSMKFQISNNYIFRILLLIIVTLPWCFRKYFPVHSFSDNYTKNDPKTLISILYRIKKYQYVFYKHVLLHGLNISIAISGNFISSNIYFRLYWLALNTSYVMEFFLQTMVKKKVLSQRSLLILQKILMFFSSTATLPVLIQIPILIPLFSCIFNFKNRGHDFMNTMIVFSLFFTLYFIEIHFTLFNFQQILSFL